MGNKKNKIKKRLYEEGLGETWGPTDMPGGNGKGRLDRMNSLLLLMCACFHRNGKVHFSGRNMNSISGLVSRRGRGHPNGNSSRPLD